jgi:type II secretory pathway component PulC
LKLPVKKNIIVRSGKTIGEAKHESGFKDCYSELNRLAQINPGEEISFMLSREDIKNYSRKPSEILKASMGLNINLEGKIEGYKIYNIPSGHVFRGFKLENGDIVKRVNGMPLNDIKRMLDIWNSILDYEKITVDIDRKGIILTYKFIIRN